MYSHSHLPLAAAAGSLPLVGALASDKNPISDPSSLPFTGLNVLWVSLAAVALIALSGALRRLVPMRQA
jgi:hypothetical protein